MTLTEAQYRNDIVKTGIAQVGHLYRDSSVPTNWPPQQFDCSVFTHWLNAKYDLDIDQGRLLKQPWPPREPDNWHKYPGYTLDQQQAARNHPSSIIPFADIKPGDRLYYDKPGQHHVVMYIGGGKVVHAAGTAYGVIISPVVGPGETGHGGKTLTMCVSGTKFARAIGYQFATPTSVVPKPTPVKQPTVFVAHIRSAIRQDGPAAQGHTTFKREVLLVESALAKEGFLEQRYVDGSAGTNSFGPRSAYLAWERKYYGATRGDGLPDAQGLKALGRKYGFNVI